MDPLSHMAEGDWAIPLWVIALLFGAACLRGAHAFFSNVAPLPRRALSLGSGLIGTATAMIAASVLLIWLGYID